MAGLNRVPKFTSTLLEIPGKREITAKSAVNRKLTKQQLSHFFEAELIFERFKFQIKL